MRHPSLFSARLVASLVSVALSGVACIAGSGAGSSTPGPNVTVAPTSPVQSPSVSPSSAPTAEPASSAPPRGGTWTAGIPLLDARSEHSVTVLGDRILAAGGFLGRQTTDTVDAYDVAFGSWTRLAPMPEPRDHTAIVGVDGAAYILGGAILGRGAIRADAWRYDPAANTWTAVAPLPRPRAFHAATVLDGAIYVVGGIERPSDRPTPTLRYDPVADAWAEFAAIPTEREHLAAVALDGLVYAIGGRIASNSAAFEAFDPATDAWTRLPDLPTARSGLAAAVLDGRIHVLGGEQVDPPRIFADHEVYDPVVGSWDAGAAMTRGRHGFGAVVFDGVIYAIAGGPNPDLSATDRVDIFTP